MTAPLKKSIVSFNDSFEPKPTNESILNVYVGKANTPESKNVIMFEIDVQDIYMANHGLSVQDAKKLRNKLDELIELTIRENL